MLLKNKKTFLLIVPTILVIAALLWIHQAKKPDPPLSIPQGDYALAVEYAHNLTRWAVKRYHLPSLAVSLISDQDTIWQDTSGFANREQDSPAQTQTVYKLWSVSKVFTAFEVLRLVQDGLVDLDAPITTYLPDFSIQSRFTDSEPITIRSILDHRSGLPRNECHWVNVSQDVLTELAASLADCYQVSPVGDQYKYSNIGFDLLGYLIQEMRGESFPAYMRDHLLYPIGMQNSAFLRSQVPTRLEIALGYEYFKGKYDPYTQNDTTSFPSGNLYSTIDDMQRFVKFLFKGTEIDGNRWISPKLYAEMFPGQSADQDSSQLVNLGWKKACLPGTDCVIWHDGGAGEGIGSLVALLPDQKLGVILIANSTAFEGSVSLPIAQDILAALSQAKYGNPVLQSNPPTSAKHLSDHLEQFTGRYAAFGKIIQIYLQGNQLKGKYQDISFDLVPLTDTTFQASHWLSNLGAADFLQVPDLRKMQIEFKINDQDSPDALIINFGGIVKEICPRYPHFAESPLDWAELTGEYDLLARLPAGAVGDQVLGETSIQVQDGILQMAGLVGPLLPISETEIIILSGPFAGETMLYQPAEGTIYHQSIVYRPR